MIIFVINFLIVDECKRGYSSVGRAPALQAGRQEFESPYLHIVGYFVK